MERLIPTAAPGLERHAFSLAARTYHLLVEHSPKLRDIDRGDLWGAALLGAAKALDRWDETRGVKFASYAIACIRGEILEEMRRQDWLSRAKRKKAREEWEATGEFPAWGERPASLDDVQGSNEDGELIRLRDTLPDPVQDTEAEALEHVTREQLGETMRGLVAKLPPLEQYAIQRVYWDGATCAEVGEEIDRSKSRAKQLRDQGERRLAQWAAACGLED